MTAAARAACGVWTVMRAPDAVRAAIDVELPPGQGTDLRAFLKSGNKALTETWTFPWKAP